MKQEIVLPKFKIPGQANWLVRGLWIGGGVIVLLTGLIVWGLARQRSEQEIEARRAREAQQAAAAAAAVAPAKPVKPVRAASKTLATTKAPLARATLEPARPGSKLRGGKSKATRARAGYHLRKKTSRQSKLFATKAAARGGARPAPKAKPSAGKGKGGDAIDDILRNFK